MALTLDTIEARYEFIDVEDSKSYVSLYLPNTVALADAITFFDAVGDKMVAINGCVNTQYQIIGHYIEGAYTPPNPLEDDVEYVALFEVETADNEMFQMIVPSVDEDGAFYETDNLSINQVHTTIAPFLTMLIDGDGTVAPCDQRGQDLVETSGTTGSYKVVRAVKYHTRSHVSGGVRAG
jgi:hypothetical protein